MNHKVFRSVFVLAVALALAAVMARIQDAPEVPAPRAVKAAPDNTSRVMASYRVREQKADGALEFVGANYKARITETGVSFGAVPEKGALYANREFTVELGTPRIQQGELELECQGGKLARPVHAVAQIDRGAVIEEYVLENRRIEQLFRFPAAIGTGALRVAVPVKTDLGGQVVVHSPTEEGWRDPRFAKGGLEFQDKLGEMKVAVYGAVVIDADGRQLALAPKYERTEMVLEVPAEYMAKATYPVVIDPWFDVPTAIGTGFRASEKPVIAKSASGSGLIAFVNVAWSDNSTGNFEIYVLQFDPEEPLIIRQFAGSLDPGGISNTATDSVTPAIANIDGFPMVAWEDDLAILFKKFNGKSGAWEELGGSAAITFRSKYKHPSVAVMDGVVPGAVTVDGSGNVTSQPPSFPSIPVVCFDNDALREMYCIAFYPGAPAIPENPVTATIEARIAVPAGWYPLTGSVIGGGVSAIDFGQFPSLVVDSLNQPAIAYESTSTGNYEVFVTRWLAGTPANFQVIANDLNLFELRPVAAFSAPTNVSSTAGPSQFPNMAVDDTNLTVAWQETESAAPPAPPGLTSQIYVSRSAGLGGFGLIGLNPGFPGGISDTLAMASTPSIDVGGGYIGVAWADTSNGRSSIYVRRLPLGGLGGLWEQVGFQGSAFPPAFVGEVAPIGGVSQSANFAIQPSIALDIDGNPTVVWADGDQARFQLKGKKFFGNAPGTASGIGTTNPLFNVGLQQSSTDPAIAITPIAPGEFSSGNQVWLFARVFTETVSPPTTTLRLEIEIQPAGAGFTGFPNVPQTLFVAPDDPTNPTLGNLASIQVDGLPNFNYHWRARTIDQVGRRSQWVSAPEFNGVSFRINGGAGGTGGGGPPNVTPIASASTPSKGSCGLTGLEAVALLGLLSLIRRNRAK
jgi:hypothetical protein